MISTKAEQMFDPETPPENAASLVAKGNYDDRLNRILKVATRVIAREGYQKASMRLVAKAAGTSLAATAAADPPEEPPGEQSGFHGFFTGPK